MQLYQEPIHEALRPGTAITSRPENITLPVCNDFLKRVMFTDPVCDPQVQKLAADSADFARFIRDPTISREQKGAALSSISQEMKLSELTSRFIGAQHDDITRCHHFLLCKLSWPPPD